MHLKSGERKFQTRFAVTKKMENVRLRTIDEEFEKRERKKMKHENMIVYTR